MVAGHPLSNYLNRIGKGEKIEKRCLLFKKGWGSSGSDADIKTKKKGKIKKYSKTTS